MSKVKKQFTIRAVEVVVGDNIHDYGEVVCVNKAYERLEFACLSAQYGRLIVTEDYHPNDPVLIYREVEKPDEITIPSLFLSRGLFIKDVENGGVQLKMFEEREGTSGYMGRVFDAAELIDAIKAVKGID